MNAAAGLIMDVVLMGLLLTALWFGMRLNARLKTLRNGQESFIKAVSELDQAALKAHASLRELYANADESQELLHGRIIAARDVLSKLESQINRAERVQRDLESGVTEARMTSVQAIPAAPRPGAISGPADDDEDALPQPRRRKEEWAGSRGAEARQTYAGRARPAFDDGEEDDAADDLPLPHSRRLREMNDRLNRKDSRPPPPEVHQDDHDEVSEIGLQAINEMLRAFADPKAASPRPAREPVRDVLPERRPKAKAEPEPKPSAQRPRRLLPPDDDLFGDGRDEVPDDDADHTPPPPRPLFRRTR